jgi:enamine deaminase RidA (YjgF/YER057c/UK114 family)
MNSSFASLESRPALPAAREILTLPPARPKVTPEFVVTERAFNGEPADAVFARLAAQLRACRAELLSLMVYSAPEARDEIAQAMRHALGDPQWPVTWIESPLPAAAPFAGVQAFAISGVEVERVRVGKTIVGSIFEDGAVRHCLLGGLGPTSTALQPAAQVQQTFANLGWALAQAGFEFADVVRTWFYNDDIVAWYPAFNHVRSSLYRNIPWRSGSLPASTGIGARNPAGAALTLAAWAVQALDGATCAREVASPLQCPAPAYGSSFSRAMEIDAAGFRRLFISGTASIEPGGATVWVGNARKQIQLTMEVVGAILTSRGMTFDDITRATAYFRKPELKAEFDRWTAEHEMTGIPAVATDCIICRDDLLFEIEVDAYSADAWSYAI